MVVRRNAGEVRRCPPMAILAHRIECISRCQHRRPRIEHAVGYEWHAPYPGAVGAPHTECHAGRLRMLEEDAHRLAALLATESVGIKPYPLREKLIIARFPVSIWTLK